MARTGCCCCCWLSTETSDIDVINVIAITANCVAVAAPGVTSYACGSGAAVGGASPTSVDNYDDYSVLSRLHQAATHTAAVASTASFRPPSYCTATSQMRPGGAAGTAGVVRGGTLHGGQAPIGPGPTAGQTALPYPVGFALSPGDMMRQPPLAGFQGVYTKLQDYYIVSLFAK